MSNPLVLAALITLSGAAAADPTPPTPPTPPPHPLRIPNDVCRPTGDVLFQIDNKVEPGAKYAAPASTTRFYATGAWTFASTKSDGKPERAASGCLDGKLVASIREDLRRATWRVLRADAACAAISSNFLEYSAGGKLVWTQHTCQLDYLDEASAKSLAEITTILADATAPHTPPCCKK